MSNTLFRPFDHYRFDESTCFLTGKPAGSQVTVFPEWLMEQYHLGEKAFKMMDERVLSYRDIRVPASQEAIRSLVELEAKVGEAFSSGYAATKELDSLTLFQWVAKQVYGIIHWEIRAGMQQQRRNGEEFNFSQSIAHKFSNLHIMLQSLVTPVEFEGQLPWSIDIFRVENGADTFRYRDEMNTLVFSLRMNDFGIIATLQDNGESLKYQAEINSKVKNEVLHPIQFEELCARYFYSAYLFNRLPEYTVLETSDGVFIEPMPLRISSKPVYDFWQHKTYAQVLENFWRPWGFLLLEIIKNPEKPLSFLEDHQGNFIPAETIGLEPH